MEKNKLQLQTYSSSMRKDDVDIRATILMEYENEEKRFSPSRLSNSSTKEFKFSMIYNDKNYLKDFEMFSNNYSQDYKNIDLSLYQQINFELQVKPSIEDRLLRKFTNENMFVDEDTDFLIIKEFDENIFTSMKNGYSKDFKFQRNRKISKDDIEMSIKEKTKILI